MIIPVGLDDEEVRRRPWVSYAIIGINVAVFVVLWLEGAAVGNFGFVPAHRDPVRLLTSLFVHAGLAHLLGNMIFLYVTGPLLEDAYGRLPFTLLYLLAGVFAYLADASHDPTSLSPRVGASGAIAGVMGAFLVRFARRRIRFLWMPLFPLTWASREFRVPAFVYLPFWFLLQYGVALVSGDASGVAVWAHVGGFAFGFLAALLVTVTGIERRLLPSSTVKEAGGRANTDLVQAIKEGRLGHLDAARRATDQVLAADPRNTDALRYAYELAVESGYREEIAQCSSRLLDRYVSLGEKDLARGLIRDVGERGFSNGGIRFLLRAGEFLARDGQPDRALELYDVALRVYPEHPSALHVILKVAELRQTTGDLTGAREALERARRHPDCAGQWLQVFKNKEAELSGAPASSPPAAAMRAAPRPQPVVPERSASLPPIVSRPSPVGVPGPSRRRPLLSAVRWFLAAPVALGSYGLPILVFFLYAASAEERGPWPIRVFSASCLMLSAMGLVYFGSRVAPSHNGRVAMVLAALLFVVVAGVETQSALQKEIWCPRLWLVIGQNVFQLVGAAAVAWYVRKRPVSGFRSRWAWALLLLACLLPVGFFGAAQLDTDAKPTAPAPASRRYSSAGLSFSYREGWNVVSDTVRREGETTFHKVTLSGPHHSDALVVNQVRPTAVSPAVDFTDDPLSERSFEIDPLCVATRTTPVRIANREEVGLLHEFSAVALGLLRFRFNRLVVRVQGKDQVVVIRGQALEESWRSAQSSFQAVFDSLQMDDPAKPGESSPATRNTSKGRGAPIPRPNH